MNLRRFFWLSMMLITLGAIGGSAFQPTLAQDSSVFPVTIEHKFGSTTITKKPERIVVLGYTEQDIYFALGEKPVAVREWFGEVPHGIFPWAVEAAGDAEPIVLNMPYGSLNYEAILELQPDLISAVDAGITQEEYERLSQIAPTLAQTDDYIDFGTPWQEATRLIGKAIGKSELTEEIVTDIEQRFAEVRAENPQFQGKTVSVSFYTGDTYGYYTAQDSRARFFTDLGFVVPDKFNEIAGDSFYAYISEERLDLFDQDLLVFLGLQFSEDGRDGALEAIKNNPILSNLKVVKENRVLYVPDDLDVALQFSSVLSLDYLLDGLVPQIVAVIPKEDSSTVHESSACAENERAVQDAIGVIVCVPLSPQRVITLTDGDTDALVALGINPVGVSNGRGAQTPPRYLLEYLPENYVSVGGFFQPNLEVVLELEPDLILFSYADFASEELLEQLRQIAPVFVPVSGDGSWRDLFVNVGLAMNLESEVEAFLADFDERVEALSEKIEPNTQFIIARWAPEGPQVMAPYIFAPAILQEIGFVMPDEIPDLQEGHAHSAPLSLEALSILDVDWLFVGTLQAEGDAVEALEEAFDNPLFQQLEVFQNDHVVVVDGSIWTSSGGPLAANLVLDVLEAVFLEQ